VGSYTLNLLVMEDLLNTVNTTEEAQPSFLIKTLITEYVPFVDV
jgi:hypothetical protein